MSCLLPDEIRRCEVLQQPAYNIDSLSGNQLFNAMLIGLLVLSRILTVFSYPCDEEMAIELLPGDYELYPNRSLLDKTDGTLYKPSQYWETETKGYYKVCLCQLATCIVKCCGVGSVINLRERLLECEPSNSSLVHPFSLPIYDDTGSVVSETTVDVENNPNYALLIGYPACGKNVNLECVTPNIDEVFKFRVLRDGNLRMTYYMMPDVKLNDYCVDVLTVGYADDTDGLGIAACICVFPGYPKWPFLWAQIASVPFLFVTFLVFASVQELRNFHGKCLMCYVSSLMTWFVFRSFLEYNLFERHPTTCLFTASILQFSELAAFFWLNVMCFDVWWTFSGRKVVRNRREERKIFILCSVYSWGCPLLICSATAFVNLNKESFSNWPNPKFASPTCFFNNVIAQFLYLFIPGGILLFLNIIMFLRTSSAICGLRKQTKFLRRTDSNRRKENNRQRFLVYLKLFVLMGASFTGQGVSWFYKSRPTVVLGYISYICYSLSGVFVFILFVCNRKTLALIRKRICPLQVAADIADPRSLVSTSEVSYCNDMSLQQMSSDPKVS